MQLINAALEDPVNGWVFTQYNMKQGIKVFGQGGVDAVMKELKQIVDMDVLEPRLANHLANSERKDAIAYLMFLK